MKQTKQFLRPLLMAIVMTVGMLVPKGAWAQSPVTVGDEEFSTISEAIDFIVYGAEFDATLTLHQDLTLEDGESIDISFESGSEYFNFTIDLNGHTITGGCEWDNNSIGFYNNGLGLPTVTIANGKLFNCVLDLNPNTKVIVGEGVSLYPRFELVGSSVVNIASETSLVNNGDIYGAAMVNFGGSFINNGRVAYVDCDGDFENYGGYCAYFNWADDGSSFRAYINNVIYDYDEEDEYTSIASEVTKEPTCTEPGLRTVTGTILYEGQEYTDTKEVEIPAGHVWEQSDECFHHCTQCDQFDNHLIAVDGGTCVCGFTCPGHSFGLNTEACIDASDFDAGKYVTVSVCYYCDYTVTETVDPDGACPLGGEHQWCEDESVAATCTMRGYTIRRCDNCDKEYICAFTAVDPDNHNWFAAENGVEDGSTVNMHICNNGCDAHGEWEKHTPDTDGKCSICGYWPGHTEHQWESDNETHRCTIIGCEYSNGSEHNLVDGVCSDCGYVEEVEAPYLEIYYNDDYYATVDDLTMGEGGAYYGTFYVEESVYDDLSIDGIDASVYWVSYSYTREKVDDADVFVLTLLGEENEPVAVLNLTMVKGHNISLICDPVCGKLSVEGDYVKIDETNNHKTMNIFVLTGGECTATAESTDLEEFTFVAWNLGYEDFEVKDPTLTLTSSSLDHWEAVFSSKSYAKVWLNTYPSSVYAWLTDSEGNKICDSEGHTEFDGDGNPVDDEEYVYVIVRKGSEVTLHYDEASIGDLTFSKLMNIVTDDVYESATVIVTDDVSFGAMYQRTVKTTNGWMTYCDGSDNYTVEGGKAYTAHYQEAAGEEPACVVLTSIDGAIAWNEGILISSETGQATLAYTYEGVDLVEDNELYGNSNDYTMDIESSRLNGKILYGLYNQDPANIGFMHYTGATLPPHKAVLVAGCTAGDLYFEAPLRIVIDNEEVGIIQVAAGQDPIDAVFDLLGRRQNADNAKGLRIREGKVTWGK